ncbi:uncharacterized protein LOC126846351 isoform X4 [Adelges cooleyi]|uniref:uncharacterized protein LOC126846351 isoform X4 n=1 Tax=Adelges cooleyi TaxID=133065 RepID=UPI00217F5306|nr:uncharacterized protein LOC126846351 isoform X4 [Adelges cooleyi]
MVVQLRNTTHKDNSVFFISTEDKINKKTVDCNKIKLQCSSYEKVDKFELMKIVAVEIDGNWLRGKLLSHNEYQSDNTIIELIDEGSIYRTKMENLYTLPYYFLYDPLALPIKFKNTVPKNSTFRIKPLLSESELHEGFVIVDVDGNESSTTQNEINRPPLNIKNLLSFNKVTPSVSKNDTKLTNGYCNGVSSVSDLPSLRKGSFNSIPKKQEIPFEKGDHCIITHYENLKLFYVAKTINQMRVNNDILEQIELDEVGKIPKLNPVVGDTVTVYSSEYGMRFRAIILKPICNDEFEVYYIDFGNKEVVSSKNIFKISDKFLSKNGSAVEVGTNPPSDLKITPAIENMFKEFINTETEFLIVDYVKTDLDRLENIKLKNVKNGLFISSLVMKCLSDEKESAQTTQENQNKNTQNNSIHNITYSEKNENELRNGDSVFVKHFEDSAHIFVVKDVKAFNNLIGTIIQDELHCPESNFQIGNLVKIVLPKSEYRAKIINTNGNEVRVKSLDFGITDQVSTEHVYKLSEELKKIPPLIKTIGLKGPFIKCNTSVLAFVDKIENIKYTLEFDEKNPNCLNEAVLRREGSSVSLIDEIVKAAENQIENKESNSNLKIEKPTKLVKQSTLSSGDICAITYFQDFNCIYVAKLKKEDSNFQLCNIDIVAEIMNNEEGIAVKTEPKVGEVYKVKSPSDNQFYRGKIISIDKNTSFEVFYIDFGNTENVKTSDIFELEVQFKEMIDLPVLVGIKVHPNTKITEKIKNLFSDLADENIPLIIEFEDCVVNKVQYVRLKYLDSEEYVNDKVLDELKNQKNPFKSGDICLLTHFQDFKNIYVSKAIKCSENNYDLHNIIMEVATITPSNDDLYENPAVGEIVIVNSILCGGVFRAVIKTKMSNGLFDVLYIDFGNTEIVEPSQIFKLSEYYKNQPWLAIKIGLNINLNAINDSIKDIFENLSQNVEPLIIEFDDMSENGLENCILKKLSDGHNLNDEVSKYIPCEVPVTLEQKPTMTQKDVDKIVLNEAIITDSTTLALPINTILRNNERVIIRYFHDTDNVYVSKESELEAYYQLISDSEDKGGVEVRIKNRLFKLSSTTDITNEVNPQVGCIVKIAYANLMCRAKILEIRNGGSMLKVQFIDFGNVEVVSSSDVYQVSEDIKKIPSQVFHIGLKDLPYIQKTDKIETYIADRQNIHMYIVYDEDNPNGLKKASLRLTETNDDVFETMCIDLGIPFNKQEKCLTKNDTEDVNEVVFLCASESGDGPDAELNNDDIVYCSHFEDFNNLYICKGSWKTEIPNNYDVMIDSSKPQGIKLITNPKLKEIVRVKYEDEFIRGEVLAKRDRNYKVFLIDVGKIVIVDSNNIFELPDRLKKIPGLAKKVGLKNINDLPVTPAVREYFKKLWDKGAEIVPLILKCNVGQANYLDSVELKKKCSGRDIIDELAQIAQNKMETKLNESYESYESSNSSYTKIPLSILYPKSGDKFELLFANNVDNVMVRSVKLYEHCKEIINQLKNEKKENLVPVSQPKIHEVYVVYSEKFKGMCRGKYLGPSIENKGKFALSDNATVEYIASDNIWVLPVAFKPNKVPIVVNRVTLAGLKKCNNNKLSQYFESYIGKTVIVEFESNNDNKWYSQVTLREPNSRVSMNEEILDLMNTNQSCSLIQQRLQRKIINPVVSNSLSTKSTHPITSGSSVLLTHFENFHSIFVRDGSIEALDKVRLFNRNMLAFYRQKNSTDNEENIAINEKVCVSSSTIMYMYSRAVVLSKSGDKYYVRHIDYGIEEYVSSNDIYKLDDSFKKLDDIAIKVQVQNIPKISESELNIVKEYVQKNIITPSVVFNIEFNELNPHGLNDVVMKMQYNNKDFADEIRNLLNTSKLNIQSNGNPAAVGSENGNQNIKPPLSPYLARKHIFKKH